MFHCSVPCVNKGSPHVRESKTVLDSGFHAVDSRFFVSGTWVLDSNRQWDSGFLQLYSGFQIPGFCIPPAPDKIAVFQIPDSRFLFIGRKGLADIVPMTAYRENMAKRLI